MKAETLERLMIDRELGELAPDAEDLLAAYLDGNADASRSVEDIRDVIEMAGRAVRVGSADEHPPLPAPRFLSAVPLRRHRSLAMWAKPVAAAAVIGMAFWLGSLRARPNTDSLSVPLVNNDVTPTPLAAEDPHGGFWSLTELRRRSSTHREHRLPNIQWPGPVSRPRLGDRS